MGRPRKNTTTQLTAKIEYMCQLRGYKSEDIAKLLSQSVRTLERKKSDNTAFKVYELEKIAKQLGIVIVISPDGVIAEEVGVM